MDNEFIKNTRFSLVNSDGDIFVSNISINDEFVKKAENDFKYDKAILDYIDTKLKPVKGKSYLLINAMGASDYFGSNLNADWFSEPVLEDFHKTFETYGRAYRHHVNKDESIAEGKVIFSSYNKKMHRVELIVEVDDSKVRDILEKLDQKEIPATSMACFSEGTGIVINNFITKPIEQINIGDDVLTHSGKLQKVTEVHTRDYNDLIYKINPIGKYRKSISCTKEHPLMVVDIDNFYTKTDKGISRNKKLSLENVVFKTAEELTGEEYLVVPKPTVCSTTDITPDMAKLLGWYLAKGHTHIKDNGVEFTVNKTDQIVKEIEEAAKFLNTQVLFKTHSMSPEALRIIIYSDELKTTCLKYCGKYCDRKILHEEIFTWPEELKLKFLGAYISGDGFYYNNIYISSVNKKLLEQIQWLCYSLGIITTLGRNIHKIGEQRFTDYDQTEWILRFRKTSNPILSTYCSKIPSTDAISIGGATGPYIYDDFYLIGIESIETEPFSGPVYNLEVENDNTYVVEQYAVHNCKVSHDICSICGNKAKSRKDYCVHLKYFKNKIHSPSTPIPGAKQYGQKVYAINPDPKFFDISFVKIPADATSSVITKLAEAFGKKSAIKKEIVIPMKENSNVRVIPADLIDAAHGSLSKEEMKKLLEKYSSAEIMSHMVLMNMMPSRKDFQYMHLVGEGLEKYAEILYDNNIVFDCTDVTPDDTVSHIIERTKFNPELGNELSKFGERLGMGEPLVVSRILTTDFEKVAQARDTRDTIINTVPYFLGVGGAYYGYNKYLDKKVKSGWGDFARAMGFKEKPPPAASYKGATWLMRQHPLLLGSGLVGAGILANYAQKGLRDVKTQLEKQSALPDAEYLKTIAKKPGLGHFLTATAIVSPLAFLYSSHNRDKMSKGQEVSSLGAFAARHPYITALGGVGATYIPKKIALGWDRGTFGRDTSKMVKTSSVTDYISYLYHFDREEYEKIYSDLINY